MKKTLIALAVLAASGAAMAQSTVTLYGVADVWLGSNKVEVNGVGERQNVIDTSGVNGSRWGLKGSEDLGGGLKAIFQLESGFKQDTGAQKTAGSIFDRQAFVGVQGGFGTVSMGRQYSAYDNLHGAVDHNYDAFTFLATGLVAANGMADYTNRISNSIQYISPDFSGFSGAVVYGFGENKNWSATGTALPGQDATNSASLHVKYANGPLLVGYAYQEDKQPLVAGLSQDKNKYNLIGGTYDFGVAKLVGSYNTAKNNTTSDKEYQVGVVVPFGAAAISAGYAHSKSEAGGLENKGDGFALLGTYAMSKRTGLYAGAVNTKAHVNNAAAETKTTIYGLGMRHSF
jgi:predicted porin